MKLWTWQEGRQKDCSYKKMCLWSFRLNKWGFDAYLLRYERETYLPLHRDPIPEGGKHWRLNIGWGENQFHVFDSPKCGWSFGKFSVYLFRPDLYLHSLTVHEKTTKLSFGFVKFD